jgi:hypothetical protein
VHKELEQPPTTILTAEASRRLRVLVRNAKDIGGGLKAQGIPLPEDEKQKLDGRRNPMVEAALDVATALDVTRTDVGAPEIIDAVGKQGGVLVGGLNSIADNVRERGEALRGGLDRIEENVRLRGEALGGRLDSIADNVASFSAGGTSAEILPTFAPSIERAVGREAFQRVLGVALPVGGRETDPEFFTQVKTALDQRFRRGPQGYELSLTAGIWSLGATTLAALHGGQVSLKRELATYAAAFIEIVLSLPSRRRDPDDDAIADHRARLERLAGELPALAEAEGGPLIERLRTRIQTIRTEWHQLRLELGAELPNRARLATVSFEVAGDEEHRAEAERADNYLDAMNKAVSDWRARATHSGGVLLGRFLQRVRSLVENVTQVERAFDMSELTHDDRLGVLIPFESERGSLQHVLDWVRDDARMGVRELTDGDARISVIRAMIDTARAQHRDMERIREALDDDDHPIVTVGRARVRRALNEVVRNLDEIVDEGEHFLRPRPHDSVGNQAAGA